MTTKTISRATYLQALGLHTMARRHADRCEEFRKELLASLGVENGGHLDDAVYDDRRTFDEALKLEGYTVAPEDAG